MSIQIKTPNITAATDREKLQQMQSYLYQMAQQLQWAFDTIDTGGSGSSSVQMNQTVARKKSNGNDVSNFSELKSLIIKSADIVDAYYMQISRKLKGQYVSQSDFGTYAETTEQEIQENSTNITQLFSNIREISGTVDRLYDDNITTNAYLKSGLLEEKDDGSPVYGLEIGQTNSVSGQNIFDKFARFTADRLSFYDGNDIEVAYISDYKLYITNADITGSLYLTGKFRIYYNNGLAFQWTGGQ